MNLELANKVFLISGGAAHALVRNGESEGCVLVVGCPRQSQCE